MVMSFHTVSFTKKQQSLKLLLFDWNITDLGCEISLLLMQDRVAYNRPTMDPTLPWTLS